MAAYLVSILLMGLILSVSAIDGSPTATELAIAVAEMQSASYFTFAMLVQMLRDKIPANITFLMPSDRIISKVSLSENTVSAFLFSHSIPLPLLFEHLEHFPSGTKIPTYESDFMLRVSNNGRRRFSLNNVEIVRPNICLAGSSIRCHGINGVLNIDEISGNRIIPPPPPFPTTIPIAESPHETPPSSGSRNLTPATAPPSFDSNPRSQRSGSSDRIPGQILAALMYCFVLPLIGFQL